MDQIGEILTELSNHNERYSPPPPRVSCQVPTIVCRQSPRLPNVTPFRKTIAFSLVGSHFGQSAEKGRNRILETPGSRFSQGNRSRQRGNENLFTPAVLSFRRFSPCRKLCKEMWEGGEFSWESRLRAESDAASFSLSQARGALRGDEDADPRHARGRVARDLGRALQDDPAAAARDARRQRRESGSRGGAVTQRCAGLSSAHTLARTHTHTHTHTHTEPATALL